MGCAVFTLGGWKYAEFERGWLKVAQESFRIGGLPPAFSGMRIAHLSDLHFNDWMTPTRFAEVVDLVNEAAPDVVMITGDFIDARTVLEEIPLYAASLKKISGPKGKFAVVGNHDHWRDVVSARCLMDAGGLEDLSNRSTELKTDGDSIQICGLDSYMEGNQDLEKVIADLREGDVAILLVHEPDFADISGATGLFALQLSGHSHGGQVYIPLLGPPVTPDFGRKYPRGRYQVEKMHLYTNPGIGMITPYVRLNCRPEITMITLESDMGQD